jgi:hypothetical protein
MEWQNYKQLVKDQGLDVCHVTLCLTDAYRKAGQGSAEFKHIGASVSIIMHNNFAYQVQKPRQEPFALSCVKPEFRRTFSSILFEAYVVQKASKLGREFSYLDFLELKHDAFRRIAMRLKRKGEILTSPVRTVPQFYYLASSLQERAQNQRTTE